MDIRALRENYSKGKLTEDHLVADPLDLFSSWMSDALKAELPEPNAMVLSTVNADGHPSSRVVLLKEIDTGFIFYTNYTSAKAEEMEANNQVALCFLWKEIERQVRIEGSVEKISKEKSEAYFHARPRGSQIGAWTSYQSQIIQNRGVLENRLEALKERFSNVEKIPFPDFWGGYRIVPTKIEFWQGRESRLHDRIVYKREDVEWVRNRLSP